MSEHEDQNSEMTSFEQDLAALGPRVDGFDRERLIFLAGRAAALRDCSTSAIPASRLRWAWPAAFSTMTAVAAALLAMLCIRPAAIVATGEPTGTGSSIAKSVPAAKVTDSQPQSELPAPPTQREGDFADTTFPEADLALRAELRRRGIDFSGPRVAASNAPMIVAEAPLTYFELLSRLQGKGPAGQGGLKELIQ